MPSDCASTRWTSVVVNTVGRRAGRFAISTSSSQGSGVPRTSQYKNRSATPSLILGGSRDVCFAGEICGEFLYVRSATFCRMSQPAKAHEPPHPLDIAFLRADAVMFDPDDVAHTIEQPPADDGVSLMCLLDG